MTGQSPIDDEPKKNLGWNIMPRPILITLKNTLMKRVSLKNLMANGTVPYAFSSIMAEGI